MKFMFLLTILLSLSFMDFDLAQQKVNSAESLTYSGQLEAVFAIGGETTGIGLRTGQGELLELKGQTPKLQQELHNLTQLRSKISANGKFITVRGVEIPIRRVLSVKKFEQID